MNITTKSTMTADHECEYILQRINELVESSPMSRKEIANIGGMSVARMRRKLRGETVLMTPDLFMFARVFQIKPSALMAH
ncbi:hypothetical protein [Specibacter sp. RAF43]|uniref:hypothetical protein n=1 Tax=Specibacter sp. RAF43 TaxID=3233057 RepID=UPI003F9EA156